MQARMKGLCVVEIATRDARSGICPDGGGECDEWTNGRCRARNPTKDILLMRGLSPKRKAYRREASDVE
jgi:hypothetical protein